jgi:hypothetical protein
MVAQATGVAVSNAEVALCQITGQNFNNPNGYGNLVSFSVYFTDTNAGNLTLRVRQGSGTGGTVVGIANVTAFGAGQQAWVSGEFQDTSAFANNNQGAAYTLTAIGSVATLGTATQALLELETVSPVI